MSTKTQFEAVIQEGRGGGAFVELPFDIKQVFGTARPKVLVTFDGEPYRGSVATMGGTGIVGVLKAIRKKLGKDIGDRVTVTIEPDMAPREVTIPADVRAALMKDNLEARFEALAYTHRREHINAIEEAKQEATRLRRIGKLIDALKR